MFVLLIAMPFLVVGAWVFAKYLFIVMALLIIGAALSGLLDAMFNVENRGGEGEDE